MKKNLWFLSGLSTKLKEGRGTMVERGPLFMSLPALWFRIPIGTEFSMKYNVSPLSILGNCFDVVSLGKVLHPQVLY